MKVTILGCGPSGGVPLLGRTGGDWGQCDPANPRNRRRRASLLVEAEGAAILVDTSPDMRLQLLDAGVAGLDAILFTHGHADHAHGIDEIRALNRAMGKPMPIYASAGTLAELRRRFPYIFAAPDPPEPLSKGAAGRAEGFASAADFYKPALEPHEIAGPFEAAGVAVAPFLQDHGFSKTLGFRFGRLAYSTDVVGLDEAAFAALAGVEVWIVDCYRRRPHPTHSHLARTLEWIARVRPGRAVLTHMDIELDYEALRRELPPGVEPGYDGMAVEV